MSVIVPKLWGGEEIIVNTDLYCGKILTIVKGAQSSLHYHTKKVETFYVLEGRIALEVETDMGTSKFDRMVMVSGETAHIPAGLLHRFAGLDQRNVFIEFSTHDDPVDSYRVEPSRRAEG